MLFPMKIIKFLHYLSLFLLLLGCTNVIHNHKDKTDTYISNYSNFLVSKYSLDHGDIEFAANNISKSKNLSQDNVLAELAFNSYLINGEFNKAESFKDLAPQSLIQNYLYELPTFILKLKSKDYLTSLDFQILRENLPGFKIIFEQILKIKNIIKNKVKVIDFNNTNIFDLLIYENTKFEQQIYNSLSLKDMTEMEYFLYLGYLSRQEDAKPKKGVINVLRTEHDRDFINNFFKKDNALKNKPDHNFIISNIFTFVGIQLSSQKNVPRSYVKLIHEISIFLDPNSGFSSYYLADFYFKEKNFETALNKLKKINQNSIMYLPSLLKKYSIFKNGNQKDADLIFKKIKKRFNDNDGIRSILADNYRRNNKCVKAIKIYDKLIKRNENKKNFLYFKGSCLEKLDKWDEAKKTFKKLIRDNPNDPYSLNFLSYSMAIREEELEEAKNLILKALKMQNNNGFFIDTLGWIEFKLKNYNKALKHLQYAVKLEPNSSEILDHLGDIYLKLGRKREAIYEWKKALDGDGDIKLKNEIQSKIKKHF